MKNVNLFIFIMMMALTVVITGCSKDQGSEPDTGSRTAFLGKWNVNETYTRLTYEVNITADPNSNSGVFISNFAGTGSSSTPASAAVNGTSIVLDANQVIGEGIIINGSGTLSGTKITWNYSLDDGATRLQAIATYTKQ